jgi:hypothetical protein
MVGGWEYRPHHNYHRRQLFELGEDGVHLMREDLVRVKECGEEGKPRYWYVTDGYNGNLSRQLDSSAVSPKKYTSIESAKEAVDNLLRDNGWPVNLNLKFAV